jgi:hypothetical protein
MHDSGGPQRVNMVFHTEEVFPMVIGFCDRDDSSFTSTDGRESYDDRLNGVRVYNLAKTDRGWTLEEYYEEEMIRTSSGLELGMTLYHAFIEVSGPSVPGQVNIILPVRKDQKDRVLALMYYFGGCNGSFLTSKALTVLRSRYPEPGLAFLGYSKVPAKYLHWIADTFCGLNVLGQFSESVTHDRKIYSIQLPGYEKPHMLIVGYIR